VDFLEQYLDRSNEIIGDRSPAEARYDKEVIRWMRRGKTVKKAIAKANQKYPAEALQVTDETLSDVEGHYEYLEQHEAITRKMNRLQRT
jgi:hypothetical protein